MSIWTHVCLCVCVHGKKCVSVWEGGGQNLEFVAQCFLAWASCFLQTFSSMLEIHGIYFIKREARSSAWIIEVLTSEHLGSEIWMSNTHFSLSVKDFGCACSILSCLFSPWLWGGSGREAKNGRVEGGQGQRTYLASTSARGAIPCWSKILVENSNQVPFLPGVSVLQLMLLKRQSSNRPEIKVNFSESFRAAHWLLVDTTYLSNHPNC